MTVSQQDQAASHQSYRVGSHSGKGSRHVPQAVASVLAAAAVVSLLGHCMHGRLLPAELKVPIGHAMP
jgi:hypothetical protein